MRFFIPTFHRPRCLFVYVCFSGTLFSIRRVREEEVKVTDFYTHLQFIELRLKIPTAAAIFIFWFRRLNAVAAKHAYTPTRTMALAENDVRIAPAYGAQAALVR